MKVQEPVSWLYCKLYTQISFQWQVSVNYVTSSSWKSLHITTCFIYSKLHGSAPTERGKHLKVVNTAIFFLHKQQNTNLTELPFLLDARNHLHLRMRICTLQIFLNFNLMSNKLYRLVRLLILDQRMLYFMLSATRILLLCTLYKVLTRHKPRLTL